VLETGTENYVSCTPQELPLFPLGLFYHHLGLTDDTCRVVLVPADDFHFELSPLTIEHRPDGIPQPSFAWFVQSLLDMGDVKTLQEMVDGMNLTFEWGDQNLDLSGMIDLTWRKQMNVKIRDASGRQSEHFPEEPILRERIWNAVTGNA
jgi:hypothetical protein